MPREGAIIFRDGKLDVLNVECNKCGRREWTSADDAA
jgi:hypothetical protein